MAWLIPGKAGKPLGFVYFRHCYKAEEMAMMIDLSKEFGYHAGTFHHGVEAYKIADHSCHFFESMKVEVPENTHYSLKVLRREAL